VGCIAERTGLTPPGIIALHQINTEMTVSICVSIQTRYHCLHAAAAAAAVGDGSIAVGLASSGAADRFVGVFPRARQAVVVAFEGQRAILSQRLSTVGRRGSWPWWRRWWGRGYGRQRSPDGLFIARFRLLCANLVRQSLTDGCRLGAGKGPRRAARCQSRQACAHVAHDASEARVVDEVDGFGHVCHHIEQAARGTGGAIRRRGRADLVHGSTATRVRCVSIFLDQTRRSIGKPQSKRLPERTQRPPHHASTSSG
jgi:hypothetical protein